MVNPRQGLRLLVGFVISGVIACGNRVLAQSRITPDNTLGTERSTVVTNLGGFPVEAIFGGAIRGANLFHSFQEFNVSAGRGAYFYSPNATIQNILARVTGKNFSEILGTLGTLGNSNPNLFLINPNGIMFGPNASLNAGGSFVATTANAVRLGDAGLFSASEPATSNLLSINPSAFFFNALSHGAISNSSRATSTVLNTPTFGLQVLDGQSLLLVGGNINLDGGQLGGVGGRVELGGLAGTGSVGLTVNGNSLQLSFPDTVVRADVVLRNGAFVDVTGEGGVIAINAQNLDVLGGSRLQAGIGVGGTANSKAGDIEINAQGAVNFKDGSVILNEVQKGAVGRSGDVRVTTGSLSLTNGAQVTASTFGQGNAGNVTISAHDAVSFNGVGSDGLPSAALSTVEQGAAGQGGNVEITTGSLNLTNGAQVGASTKGQGNAGNVTITTRDAVSLDGASSGVFNGVNTGAAGQGGNVEINTGSLSLTNGAEVNAGTFGQGNAGNVTISARHAVSLDGVDSNGFISGVGSTVEQEAVGRGGNVNITTGSLNLTNGAQVIASTKGQGNAGNVTISARDATSFDGVGSDGLPSAALSTVEKGAVGQGGNVEITTSSLSLTNGAEVNAGTFGQGNAGNVTISARHAISLDGIGSNSSPSGIGSSVNEGAVGQGGNVNITTGALSLTNGAVVNAGTFGQGNAGNVTISARDAISLDGIGSNGFPSGIGSPVAQGAVGQGGKSISPLVL